LSKAGPDYILCTLTRSGASLGMVCLNIQYIINNLLSRDFDNKDGEDGYFPFPYIFKPSTPPGNLGTVGEPQIKRPKKRENLQYEPYCKHCGSLLPERKNVCHVYGKRVK
jgi:hypothetical protein